MSKNEINANAALSELKGIANIIPNQSILINAIVLQEAKDSSEIENIITTQDELYKALTISQKQIKPEIKEVMYYREALYRGFQRIKERAILSINDNIEIQRLLIQNDACTRKTPGTALVNDKTNKTVFTQLVELLFVHPNSKVDFIVNEIGVKRKAASRYLHQLKDTGALSLYKAGTENISINNGLIKILVR